MNISNIKIHPNNNLNSKTKAFVSFVVDNTIVVHNVKIIGYTIEEIKAMPDFMHDTFLSNPIVDDCYIFVAMPSQKTPSGKYENIIHPFSSEANEHLNKEIINAYINLKR